MKQFESPTFIYALYGILAFITLCVCLPYLTLPGSSGFDAWVYARRAREIVLTHDWFTFWDSKQAVTYDHPPLFIWIMAIVFKIFGIGEIQTKCISIFIGILTVLLIFHFGRRVFGVYPALLSALFFLVCPRVGLEISRFSLNTPLLFFMLLSFYALYQLMEGKSPLYFCLWGAASALAILSKGIPGVLPMAVGMVLMFMNKIEWRNRYFFFGLCCFIIPIGLLELLYQLKGISFWKEYLMHSVVYSAQGRNSGADARPYYYYIKVLFTRMAYMSSFMVIFPLVVRKYFNFYLLILLWVFGLTFGFSLSMHKAAIYLFPINPALALCAGMVVYKIMKKYYWAAVSVIVIVIIYLSIFSFPEKRLEGESVLSLEV